MKKRFLVFFLVAVSGVIVLGSFIAGLSLGANGGISSFFKNFKNEDALYSIDVQSNHLRRDVVNQIGYDLGWSTSTQSRVITTFEGMQWDAYNEALFNVMADEFQWTDTEREVFFTRSSVFLGDEPDVLSYALEPGLYEFSRAASSAEVVETFLGVASREYDSPEVFLKARIPSQVRSQLNEYVQGEMEMMPDIVSLPPQDMGIEIRGGVPHLIFSTTYYNIGHGPLELVADPTTRDSLGDVERIVYQRIYKSDGTYREKIAGVFEWHDEHVHYHFKDFIDYELSSTENEDDILIDSTKSTYCVRDISRLELTGKIVRDADYRVCGRERQGVSVGWGDTYFRTYADQALSLEGIPSGTYKLAFIANPQNIFEEATKENNVAYSIFEYDAEKGRIMEIQSEPRQIPEVQHIYKDN